MLTSLLVLLSDHWRHDWQPVLVRIPFPKIGPLTDGIPIRYYSLAYLFGLALAWWFMKRLATKRLIALDENMVADLVIPFALLGVMVGGRLGYVLFYDVDPVTHRYVWLDHPEKILKIWEGGMASHGGILGVLIAFWIFARSRKVPLAHVLDLACLTAPMGLFLGRVANFINGELWGRPSLVKWAVIFPASTPVDEAWKQANPDYAAYFTDGLVPRHPSQLYEALGEGLFLFLILLALHRRLLPKSGGLTAIFLLGYGLARVVCEQFREPDRQIGYEWLGLTRGQWLTSVMFVAGFILLWRVVTGRTAKWTPVAERIEKPDEPAKPAGPAKPTRPTR
jgi:phosphatidylglycerol:prolipoprotein diacylglycerol transferase